MFFHSGLSLKSWHFNSGLGTEVGSPTAMEIHTLEGCEKLECTQEACCVQPAGPASFFLSPWLAPQQPTDPE